MLKLATTKRIFFPLHWVRQQQYRQLSSLLPKRLLLSSLSSLITKVTFRLMGKQKQCVCEESGPVTHLLGKGLLQSSQGGVSVGGVSLQGSDSLLQAAHLLFLISKLLLEIFNLSCVHTFKGGEKRKLREIQTVTIKIILSWKQVD